MDEIQRYLELVSEMCRRVIDDERPAHEFFGDVSQRDLTDELIRLRRTLLSPHDTARVLDFVSTGILPWLSEPIDRAAAFLTLFDIDDRLRRDRRKRACGNYNVAQPLFATAREMWDRVRQDRGQPGDLLAAAGLAWDETSQRVQLSHGWARIDQDLRPDTIRWIRRLPEEVASFVRLDPFRVGASVAPLNEATIRPAAPDWWQRLDVWPGTATGAAYQLVGSDPRDVSDYWDYARGVRRLEVSFLRRNSGHFFGTIEELSVEAPDFVVGLMLHMDSIDPVGTEWKAAVLGHLDGAINVFEGPAAYARLNAFLHNGKVPDSTTRTHLFRVEGVPLAALVPVAHLFLRSQRLLNEWVQEQFPAESLPR